MLALYLEMNFALNKFPWTCLIARNSFKLIIHWDQFPNKIYHTQSIDFQLYKPLVKLEEQIAKTTVGFPKLLSYTILSVYQRPARPLLLEYLLRGWKEGRASHLGCGEVTQTPRETSRIPSDLMRCFSSTTYGKDTVSQYNIIKHLVAYRTALPDSYP